MVKPDIKHNYYADLDLPTTASIEEIRKAYRKLALQYHPDRNAGKEEECVPRFQAIQAANEVLSDPTAKAKYDQDRRTTGTFPTFNRTAAPTGNPYQATSAYPPPPRRTQPGTYQRPQPSYPATGSAGADRFSHFPKSTNPPPRNGPAADRQQQFRAWQNLNTQSTGPANRRAYGPDQPQPPTPPARSPKPQGSSAGRPRPQRQDTKMPTEEQIRAGMRHGTSGGLADGPAAEKQSAWQAFNKGNVGKQGMPRTRTRRPVPTTPKRSTGFDPSTPGSDERPAPSATGHYEHRYRPEDLGRDAYPPPPPPPPPPPGPPPASGPSSPTSPYAPSQRPFVNPLRPNHVRPVDDDVPYAEGNRVSTPYSSFIGERTHLTKDGLRRSASTRDTTRLKPDDTARASRARSQSPWRRQQQQQQADAASKKQSAMPGMYSDSSDAATDGSSDTSEEPGLTQTPEEVDNPPNTERANPVPDSHSTFAPPPHRKMKKPTPPSSRLNGSHASFSTGTAQPDDSKYQSQSNKWQPDMKQRPSSTNIFNVPDAYISSPLGSTPGKSRSVDSFDTQFSPEAFTGTFQGNPDYFSATGRRPSPARRNPSSRGTRAATTDGTPTSTPGGMGPPPRPDSTSHPIKFSEEEWKRTFKDASWTWTPDPARAASTSSSKTPSRQSSRLRSQTLNADLPKEGTKEHPHIVPEDEDVHASGGERRQDAGGSYRDEGDEMDIDTPPQAKQGATGSDEGTATTNEPRLYSVPKSAWRESQERQHQRPALNPRKDSREQNLKTNLDDLSQVEPLAKSTDGLRSLTDMTSNLPFASQAAKGHPMKSYTPKELPLPPLPKVPDVPLRLTKMTWHSYATSFASYLSLFHDFNKTILRHFEARQSRADALMQRGSNWLEAAGDTSDEFGFGNYLKAAREDERVRETWNLGCERHLESVKAFDQLREHIRRLAASGALVDA